MSEKNTKSSINYPSDNQGKGKESFDANNKHNTRPKENWTKETDKRKDDVSENLKKR
jgi:hypothetical protein